MELPPKEAFFFFSVNSGKAYDIQYFLKKYSKKEFSDNKLEVHGVPQITSTIQATFALFFRLFKYDSECTCLTNHLSASIWIQKAMHAFILH